MLRVNKENKQSINDLLKQGLIFHFKYPHLLFNELLEHNFNPCLAGPGYVLPVNSVDPDQLASAEAS